MRSDQAEKFYEEDEDPAKVFATFDAARRQGRTGKTAPTPQPELAPMTEVLAGMAHEMRREIRQLRLRERIQPLLERLAEALKSSRSGVR
jgi:hypothetical protein